MCSPNHDARASRSGRRIRPGECTSSPDAARCGGRGGHPLSVGVDVVSVAEVSAALDRFGDRYVRRVFTAHEAAYCLAATGTAGAARFAARFAAKEAAVKALEPEGRWTDWRTIEVRRQTSGACALVLHGEAASLAARRGIRHIALSMSHDGDRAAAVVVALRASHTRHVEYPHV
jgi:holo-[acyl-carrier protein] synthase